MAGLRRTARSATHALTASGKVCALCAPPAPTGSRDETTLRGLHPLPSRQAETQLRDVQPLPARQAERQLPGVQPLSSRQAENQLFGGQTLTALQVGSNLYGLHPLPPREVETKRRCVNWVPQWKGQTPMRGV